MAQLIPRHYINTQKKSYTTFLFLLLLCRYPCSGQEYSYTQFTTKDGLAGETVHVISQDSDGFLWLATETGLSRFDGRTFRNFTTTDGLPSNEVFGCHEDWQKRLWILTFGNELCYLKGGKLYNRSNDTLLKQAGSPLEIQNVIATRQKEMLIYTRDFSKQFHFIRIDTNNKITRYKAGQWFLDYRLQKTGTEVNSELIQLPAATEEKLRHVYKRFSKMPVTMRRLSEDLFVFENGFNSQAETNSVLWSLANGTVKAIQNKKMIVALPLTEDLLVATYRYGGAAIYEHDKNRILASFLMQYVINNAFKDREGNIWFSTRGNGVFKLGNSRMMHYDLDSGRNLAVQFIYKKRDQLFVGTDGARFWNMKEEYRSVFSRIPVYSKQKAAGYFKWLVQQPDSPYVNYASSNFLNVLADTIVIKSIYPFKNRILLATNKGAYICNPKNDPDSLVLIFKDRTTCAIWQNDQYYIGTLYGLHVLDKQHRQVAQPLHCRISYFAADKKGDLWVATYDKGIYRLRQGRIIDSLNRQNSAISSNLCRCIYPDGDHLWMGTDKGLNKIRITDSGYRVEAIYTTADGLSGNIINAVLVKDSVVYVGTSRGLNIFNEQLATARPALNIKFTDISISGRQVSTEEELVLSPDSNDIRFGFPAISLGLADITYQYRLSGISEKWQTLSEPFLSLLSLPSGTYRLEVRAIHPLGYRSPVIERYFRVRKAYYEQWWFRALSAVLLAAVLWWLVRLRIRKIRSSEAEKRNVNKRIAALEQMALSAQMNPHFIFNCLNSIQSYMLRKDVEGANFYLSRFGGLVRQTLDHAPRLYISLTEELSYLEHYIELERLQTNYFFEYRITVDPSINTRAIAYPNMLLQPLVENAIKHGLRKRTGGGLLEIAFVPEDGDMLVCRIRDNGPGIDEWNHNRIHQPKGIFLTRKRLETLNLLSDTTRQITISFRDLRHSGGAGTEVTVRVPVIPVTQKTEYHA